MEKKDKYEAIYEKVLDYERQLHLKNQKRIKIGLKCLWIIPLIFLFFLFRVCRFAGEKRFKESHGCDVVLVMLFNRLTELMCRQCTVQK